MDERFAKLKEVERAVHAHMVQLEAHRRERNEVESALHALGDEAYRVVGTIMVKTDPAQVREELSRKREALGERIAALERQEKTLRAEMTGLQEQLLEGKA